MAAYCVTEYWCSKSFDPSDKLGTDYDFYIEIDGEQRRQKTSFSSDKLYEYDKRKDDIGYSAMVNILLETVIYLLSFR